MDPASTSLQEADKPLFTPGPLTTSLSVKQAMLRDLGSRDAEFLRVVAEIRSGLLAIAGLSQELGWEAVLMQGSGTFGIESVLSSLTAADGRWLVVANGAYGERMAAILATHGIAHEVLRGAENRAVEVARVEQKLAADGAFDHLAVVHCETTTGVFNPIEDIARCARAHGLSTLVDSMSAFGAAPLDLRHSAIDVLVSSANKCIEGVPGFSFVLSRRDLLEQAKGRARSLSLDLYGQWAGLERNGQFRFTPPTHALLAFHRALAELAEEGGVEARATRYRANRERLLEGTRAFGLREYLPVALQSWIITSFLYPTEPGFSFEEFYARLSAHGQVIYPGKVSDADCFRIGTIGRLSTRDVEVLLEAMRQVFGEMGLTLPLAS